MNRETKGLVMNKKVAWEWDGLTYFPHAKIDAEQIRLQMMPPTTQNNNHTVTTENRFVTPSNAFSGRTDAEQFHPGLLPPKQHFHNGNKKINFSLMSSCKALETETALTPEEEQWNQETLSTAPPQQEAWDTLAIANKTTASHSEFATLVLWMWICNQICFSEVSLGKTLYKHTAEHGADILPSRGNNAVHMTSSHALNWPTQIQWIRMSWYKSLFSQLSTISAFQWWFKCVLTFGYQHNAVFIAHSDHAFLYYTNHMNLSIICNFISQGCLQWRGSELPFAAVLISMLPFSDDFSD